MILLKRKKRKEDHMAWTETTRPNYARDGMRYASDCTDVEWSIIECLLPAPSPVGRPCETDMREVWNAINYIAATGCQWAFLPRDFPPFTTVQYYFYKWRDSGLLDIINETLVMASRLLSGRSAEPTAGIIDSQSVKTTESGGPRGFDGGKKIKGRKRHIMTDTLGNLLGGTVHPAGVQDRDGAPEVIANVRESFATLAHIFADGGYAGEKLQSALNAMDDAPGLEVIRHETKPEGFVLLARRWVVERTFGWLGRCRRLAKDWEATIASAEAWMLIASIRQQKRFIAKNAF
jgi:transposase